MDKKDQLQVTVIVPTYRRISALERAIESIYSQTYCNIEIIIVDDNAELKWNKKVKEVYQKYRKNAGSKRKIKYIVNSKNLGSARSRNKGILKATSQYITFLDDDDIYLEKKVENQINFMLKNKLDYSVSNLLLYNKSNKLIQIKKHHEIKSTNIKELERYHMKYHLTGTDTMMFKSQYLKKIGLFPSKDIGDEFYLIHNAIKHNGNFGYLDSQDVIAYVHRTGSGLSTSDDKLKGEKVLYEYKKQFINDFPLVDRLYVKMRHYAVISNFNLNNKKYIHFVSYSFLSFLVNPIGFINIVYTRLKFKLVYNSFEGVE